MSLPERSITLKVSNGRGILIVKAMQYILRGQMIYLLNQSTGDVIQIYQGGVPSSSNNNRNSESVSGRTGVALWNSGILLTRLLDELYQLDPSILSDRTVLELGCGTAVASIAALKLGAHRVIATDGNLEVVELAQANLKKNGVGVSKEEGNGEGGEADVLRWGILDAVEYYDTADIVMGSDLTYNSGTWGLLAETMDAVLKPNGIAIYLSLGHSGFSVAGELGGFQTVIESQGHLDVVSEGSENGLSGPYRRWKGCCRNR